MPMTIPYSDHLSEVWLLQRTVHARLHNGRELSVPDLSTAMTQLIDFAVPLSKKSWKSHLPEQVPLGKSSNLSVPVSTWMEVSQEQAHARSHAGLPILLFGEHTWELSQEGLGAWRPNTNMCMIISEDIQVREEVRSGTEYAVCYLDPKQGTYSNDTWRVWFPSDTNAILSGNIQSAITFLIPCVQFPFTTHYTVVASDGQVHAYPDRQRAREGFQTLPLQRESDLHPILPQFCYYHEVFCPGGIYRLEFFGPHMDEPGYSVKGTGENLDMTSSIASRHDETLT